MKFWQRVRHVVALVASSVVLASGLAFFSPQAAQAAPVVWNLSSTVGNTNGGLVVTILGTGLTNTTAVTFGGVAGTSLTNSSDNLETVTVPAHAAGVVDVVITANGFSTTLPNAFTYNAAQTLAAPTPTASTQTDVAGGFGIKATFTATPNSRTTRIEVYQASTNLLVSSQSSYTSGSVIYGLLPNTAYKVILYAIGDGVNYTNSGPSTPSTATTAAVAALTAPATATLSAASSTTLTATVGSVTGAITYRFVLMDGTATTPIRTLDVSGSSSTVFTGLAPSTPYTVKAKAIGNGTTVTDSGFSAPSAAVSTLASPVTTIAAANPTAGTVTSDSATFTIVASTPAASYYRISLYDSGNNLVSSQLATYAPNTATFTGLSSSTSYTAKVTAYGDGVTTQNSTPSSGTTINTAAGNGSTMAAPTGLSVGTPSNSAVNPSWTAPIGPNPTGYYVYLYDGVGNLVSKSVSAGTSVGLYGLRPNTTYSIGVSAYLMNYLESSITRSANFTTLADPTATPYSAPVVSLGTPTASTLTATITTGSNGNAGYQFSLYASNRTTLVSQAIVPNGTTSYTFTDLAPNTTYWVSALALGTGTSWLNSSSSSQASATTSVATSVTTLTTPTPPTVTATQSYILVTTPALTTSIISYTVRIYDAAGTTLLSTLPNYASNTIINGMVPGTTYQVSIQAISDPTNLNFNSSLESAKVLITTRTPLKLTATAPVIGFVLPNSVVLNYSAPQNYHAVVVRIYDANQNLIMSYPQLGNGATIGNLSPSTSYFASVSYIGNGISLLDSGESPLTAFTTSAPQKLSVSAPALSTASSIQTSVTQTSVAFTYSLPAGFSAVSCRLNIYAANGTTVVAQVASYNSSVVVNGLTPGTNYFASLKCFGNGVSFLDSDESPLTAFATLSTLQLLPPTIVAATTTNQGTLINATTNTVNTGLYRIKIYNANDTLIQTVSANAFPYVIGGLLPNTTYKFTVTSLATNPMYIDSVESDKWVYTTPTDQANLAGNVTVSYTTMTSTSATLNASVTTGSSLFVYRLYTSSGASTPVASISSTATQVTFSNLLPGTTYWATIQEIGTGAGFATSPESSKTTFTTLTLTQTTTNLIGTISISTLTNNSFIVSYSSSTGYSYVGRLYASDGTLLATYPGYIANSTPVYGLLPSTLYYFTIQAIGNGKTQSNGRESAKIPVTTLAPSYLTAPVIGTANAVTPGTVSVAFTSVTGAVSYTLRLYSNATGQLVATIPNYTTTAVVNNPISPGTAYRATIQAIGNGINSFTSEESAWVLLTTPPPITLFAPTIVGVTSTQNAITITYSAVSGTVSYVSRVYSADGQTLIGIGSGAALSNLQPGTTYQVSIQALGNGFSYFTSPESAKYVVRTQPALTLTAPVTTLYALNGTSVGVSYSATTGAQSYTAKVYSADGQTLLAAVTISGPQPIGGLSPNTTYQVSLTAIGNGVNTITSPEGPKVAVTTPGLTTASPVVPNLAWAASMGGVSTESANNAVLVDSANNVYVGGAFSLKSTFGLGSDAVTLTSAGNQDAFLAKYSSTGTLLWVRQAGGTGVDSVYSLAFDATGNVIMVGSYSGVASFGSGSAKQSITSLGGADGYLAKYAPDGTFAWVRQLSGTGDEYARSVSTDRAGNIFIGGSFTDNVIAGSGSSKVTIRTFGSTDGYLAKFASNGNFVWIRQVGGPSIEFVYGITVDKDGNVAVAGTANAGAVFGSGSNAKEFTAQGTYDAFVAKYTNDGDFIWVQAAGGANNDQATSVATDAAGNIYMSGLFYGGVFGTGADAQTVGDALSITGGSGQDAFLAKYGPTGRLLWVRTLAGVSSDQFNSVAIDSSGYVYAGGYFNLSATVSGGGQSQTLSSQGGTDAALAKFTSDGTLVWARTMGSSSGDLISGVGIGSSGSVAVMGTINYDLPATGGGAVISLGSQAKTLTSQGTNDIWVSLLQTGADQTASTLATPAPVISEIRSTSASVIFTPQAGASSYTLKIWDAAGTTLLQTIANYMPGRLITGLSANTTYKVSVIALGDGASTLNSAESAQIVLTTALSTTTPTVFNVGADQASLSFAPVAGASSYLVQVYDATGANRLYSLIGTPTITVLTGLAPNTTFKVAIKPLSDGLSNLNFTEGSFTTFTTAAPTTLPAPVATQSFSTATSVTINIPALLIAPQMVTGYRSFLIRTYAADGVTLLGAFASTTPLNTISGLSPATTYKVSVTEIGDGVEFLNSAEGALTLVSTSQSSVSWAPTPIVTQVTGGSVAVNYAPVPSLLATSYVVKINDFVFTAATSGSIFYTGVLPNATNSVSIQAIGDATNLFTSLYSAPITFTTPASLPAQLPAPIASINYVTPNSINVMSSAVPGALSYWANVYDSTGTTLLFGQAVTLNGVSIQNLLANTTYKIEVIAIGNGAYASNSNPSPMITVTTSGGGRLPTPINIKTTAVTATSFTASFTASLGPLAYYLKLYSADGQTLLASMPASASGTLVSVGFGSATSFKYTVTAIGDGVSYTDSLESAMMSVDLIPVRTLTAPLPSVVGITASGAYVAFTAVANSTSTTLKIYSATGTLIGIIPGYSTNVKINTPLLANTTYSVTLTAQGDGVNYLNSPESVNVSFTTPVAVKLLAPTPQIVVNQSRVATIGFAVSQIGNLPSATVRADIYSADGSRLLFSTALTSSTTIQGLAPATTYRMIMTALGDGVNSINSDPSAPLTFSTPSPITLVAPTPTITFGGAGAASFKLSFVPIAGITNYLANIYASDGVTLLRTVTVSSGQPIYGLPTGASYKIALVALGDGSTYLNSSESAKVAFTFTGAGTGATLTAPTVTAPVVTTNSVRINFTQLTGATSYTLKRYAADGTTLLATIPNCIAGTLVSNLAPATTYKFSITAIGDGTQYVTSAESTKFSVTTSALPVPQLLPTASTIATSSTATSSSITVTYPNSTGAIKYTVRVYASDGVSLVAAVNNFTSGTAITGLIPATSYFVTVTPIADGVNYLSGPESVQEPVTTAAAGALTAPTLVKSGQSSTSVSLTFNAQAGAVGYSVSLYAADGITLLGTFTPFASGDSITGLAPNTTYQIRIKALANGIGNSSSALSSALTVITGLAAPVIAADAVRSTSAAVTFSAISGASSYTLRIYNSTGATLIRTIAGYTSGAAITGLSASNTYKIQVIALGDGSSTFDSDASSWLTVSTPSPITLAKPILTATGASTTSVGVTFGAVADALSYNAKLYASDGTTLVSAITGFTSGQTFTGLTSGQTYFVTVTAIGNGSTILDSSESNQLSVLTVAQTTLTAPTATIGSNTPSSAAVTFTAVTNSLSTTLKLFAANGTTLLRTVPNFNSGDLISGLSAGTTYQVALVAIGDGNYYLTSNDGVQSALTTLTVTTLTAPSITAGSITTNAFTPTFTGVSGATAYMAKIYASNGTTLLRTVSPVVSGTSIGGFSAGTSYVIKFSSVGNGSTYTTSSDSSGVSVTTVSQINLTAPTPSVTQVSPTSLTFAFTSNPDALSTRAKLYTGDGSTLISMISNASTGMRFTGLTPDTDYRIVLESIGDGVTTISSPESSQLAAHTGQPVTLTAPTPVSSSVGSHGLTLSFTATANAISYTANIYASDGVTLISSYPNLSASGNTITGLNSSTTYKISMVAVGDEAIYLSSAESAKISITTAQGVVQLDAPNPSIDSVGSTTALVSFGAIANATSYTAKIFASDGVTLLQTLSNFTTGTAVSGLTINTTYAISLKSNGDGNNFLSSGFGSLVQFTTAPPQTLGTPTITSASTTSSTAALSFVAIDGAVDYSVKVYATDGSTLLFTISAYSLGASISGLSASTNYKFKVAANGDGFASLSSGYSTAFSATTSAPSQLTAPSPSVFSATQHTAVIVFTPIAGAVSYVAKLYAANGTTFINSISNFTSGSSISGLSAGQIYKLSVTAIGDGQTNLDSAESAKISVETPSVQVLSAPSVFVSAQTARSLTVSFAAVAGAASYSAYLYAANGTTLISTITGFNSGDSFTGLTVNTSYKVAVLARGDGADFLDSAIGNLVATSTTPIPALFVPDTIAAATGTTSAAATFSAQSNASSFELKVYAADGTTVLQTISNYTSGSAISSLSPNTTYGIAIRAIGDGINYVSSDFSSQVQITTNSAVILSAPTASAGSATFNTFVVTSGTVANATGYVGKLYSAAGNLLRTISSFASGSTISGLTAGTTYQFAVVALGDTTNYLDSPESTRVTIATVSPVQLAAPTANVSGVARDGFQFSFGAITHAVSYNATLYAANGTTVIQSWTNISGTTTVTGLSASTTYKLSMITIGDANYTTSNPSALVSVVTSSLSALPAPTGSTSSAGFNSVVASLVAVSHATGYTLNLYNAGGTLLRTVSPFTSGSTISGLTVGTTYKIGLIALADGTSYVDSAESSLITFSTLSAVQLSAPTISTSSVTINGFQFSFGAVAHAVTYDATLYAANGTTVVQTWTNVSGTTTVTGLSPNTTYKLSMTTNGDSNYTTSNPGSLVTVLTSSLPVLVAPTLTTSSATTTSIVVGFTAVSHAVSYTAKLYTSGGSLLRTIANFNSGDAITGLTADTHYLVGLTVIADGTNYVDSTESTRAAFATSPIPSLPQVGTPSITVSNITETGFDLTFNGMSHATGYVAVVYAANGSTVIQTLNNVTSPLTVTGLTAGTNYKVTLKAFGDGMNYIDSAESAQEPALTAGTAPVAPSAPATTPTIFVDVPRSNLVAKGRNVTIDLKKIFNSDVASATAVLNSNNADLSSVVVVDGFLRIKPKNYFSGKTEIQVTVFNGGQTAQLTAQVEIQPQKISAPAVTGWSLNRTAVRWFPSTNASYYRVTLDGKTVCETAAESCAIDAAVSAASKILVTPFSSDGVSGEATRVAVKLSSAPVIAAIASSSANLSVGDKAALTSFATTVAKAGFAKLVIVKPVASSPEARAKMLKIQQFLATKVAKSVKVTSKFSSEVTAFDIRLG
jgi:Beta-propeller repeat